MSTKSGLYVAFALVLSLFASGSANAHRPLSHQGEIHGSARRSASFSGAAKREGRDVLTQAIAQKRATQIESVDYSLMLGFAKQATGFHGQTTMFLKLKRTDEPLSVDALLTRIDSVKVNGLAISDYVAREGSLDIPAKYLAPETQIEIQYFNEYSQQGQGLIHFTDPADGREYIYTDSEPYGAHTYFPCFDQPDLKATYQVAVTQPAGWRAITNMPPESGVSDTDANVGFARTPRFSTYLLFVGAGEYHVWRDSTENGIPLAIYARESLAPFVDADVIFGITKKGLAFYGDYFASPYPFAKYDHVFSPDLGPGAMENPGAVTMNEKMIYRGPQSNGTYMGRANTILHEMAHHWFGDLVTMKWWDDLWLNEAFATYMASLAQDRAEGHGENAWISFAGEKGWAYWQDQLPTTHPIVVEIPDTDASGTIFDGITYGKGSAVLQQLHFYVGETAFREGVREYFRNHAWSNATRVDFVGAVARAAGTDLEPWSRGWLESKGLSRVKPEWTCANGVVTSFDIVQSQTAAGLYLPHRTKVALYSRTVAATRSYIERDVTYSDARTRVALEGSPCPEFAFVNVGDQDYMLTQLDSVSLAFASGNIESFASPLLRNQLWGVLAQMVTDREMRANDFLAIATRALPSETDDVVLGSQIGRYSGARDIFWGPLTRADRDQVAPAMEASAWAKYLAARDGSNERIYWLDHFVQLAHTPDAMAKLVGLLNGAAGLDQDRRWMVVSQLAGLGYPDSLALIEGELARDPSDMGKKQAFAARASYPDLASKRAIWQELTSPNSTVSMSARRLASQRFHSSNYPELSKEFVEPFFSMVSAFDWSGSLFVMRDIFENLFPLRACDRETLAASNAALAALPTLPYPAKRAWLEANDGLEKCILMRERNAVAR